MTGDVIIDAYHKVFVTSFQVAHRDNSCGEFAVSMSVSFGPRRVVFLAGQMLTKEELMAIYRQLLTSQLNTLNPDLSRR